ncbi:hypothetical protein RHGRI_037435 [Rhododendron griersonianum]|uniref:PB1 domain-containing protein n=1 Tax=Rhododendron griersonianum TaxID=479676 RepID=A0AAV6HUI8_9ERIC|nr:hypothetical protein RHGRI_037435 [Rhododendron griersonianum]
MTTYHHHPTDLDSTTLPDSTASSPRSDHHRLTNDLETQHPRVRFMCSFGGKILPRPHDSQLRYVGGDTRVVAVHRNTTTFSSLLNKLSRIANKTNLTVKYQLPNEDLDALITVTTDEDVENMIDEYDRFHLNTSQSHSKSSPRLRLFLFENDSVSRTSSISSLLDGSTNREHWFLDALNGGSGLERGRSEVSSIMSEMPDYLFGLDSSDDQIRDPKPKIRSENIPDSDPGSPNPVASTPFCSTSSSLAPPGMPSIPELPPVKTKSDEPVRVVDPKEDLVETFMDTGETFMRVNEPVTGYSGNSTWHYVSDPHYPTQGLKQVPVYYVPNSVPQNNVPASYVQSYPVPSGQIPIALHHNYSGMGQVYGGGARPMAAVNPYVMATRVIPEGLNQAMYYGMRNGYPGMAVPGGEELQVNGPDGKESRVFHS